MNASPEGRRKIGIAPPEYRLPETTRLGRVQLQVSSLAQSLAFYEDVLGLRVLEHLSGRAVLGNQDDEAPLVELVERQGAQSLLRRKRLGLYHVALRLPERTELARFVQHLAEDGIQSGMSDHLVSEAIYLSDPDGLGIEVYADRPRGSWEYDREGQIEMATAPLDVRALVEAAESERWAGAPGGTVVGHVHLHVGDLETAAAFYHAGLGLDKVVWSYPGALFLSAGGYHHHLGTNIWAGDVPPAGDDDARLLEWTIVLPRRDDVAAAARSLESRGFSAVRDTGTALVVDPWGTPLRIAPADPSLTVGAGGR